MKSICLVDFGYVVNSVGGAERVLADLANSLDTRGYKITIVACEEKVGKPYYYINKGVKFYNISYSKELTLPVRILRKLFKIMRIDYGYIFNKRIINKRLSNIFKEEEVDLVINFFPADLCYVMANKPHNIPVIEMLHGSAKWLEKYLYSTKDISIENRIRDVDALHVLLPSYKEILKKRFNIRVEVIPNIVPKMPRCNYTKKIVYLARYDIDKQVHLLIEAFYKISYRFPEWQLHVYGMEYTKGYKQQCQSLVQKYGLQKSALLHGSVDDVNGVLTDASICAFPSKYEGFPLALTEAMSAGLPCIGYKSCTGVNELIIDGVNGFLVSDGTDSFAIKMAALMENEELCRTMGTNATNIIKKYSKDLVINQWIELINSLDNNIK